MPNFIVQISESVLNIKGKKFNDPKSPLYLALGFLQLT